MVTIVMRLALCLAFLIAALPVSAIAQSAGIQLGGMRTDTSAPVEVNADRLELDQAGATATFLGNVVVVQGDMKLAAQEILVEYLRDADGAATTDIKQITASGGVTMVTATEAAEAQTAVYTPQRNEVVMSGDVLLTQGPNTLAGQRLVVDLVSGNGQIDGRVRTVLQPGSAEE